MTDHERLDCRGITDWMQRLRKANPMAGAIPADFGVAGDGVTDDTDALRSYQQYLASAETDSPE